MSEPTISVEMMIERAREGYRQLFAKAQTDEEKLYLQLMLEVDAGFIRWKYQRAIYHDPVAALDAAAQAAASIVFNIRPRCAAGPSAEAAFIEEATRRFRHSLRLNFATARPLGKVRVMDS